MHTPDVVLLVYEIEEVEVTNGPAVPPEDVPITAGNAGTTPAVHETGARTALTTISEKKSPNCGILNWTSVPKVGVPLVG